MVYTAKCIVVTIKKTEEANIKKTMKSDLVIPKYSSKKSRETTIKSRIQNISKVMKMPW